MVLIKYSGKYVKIYFNMKITFSDCFCKKKKNNNNNKKNKKTVSLLKTFVFYYKKMNKSRE